MPKADEPRDLSKAGGLFHRIANLSKAGRLLYRLLYPSLWVLLTLPVVSFSALIFIFSTGWEKSAAAYLVYPMSAYSLTILIAALPRLIRWSKRVKLAVLEYDPKRKNRYTTFIKRYLTDYPYRGSVGIYQGLTVNFAYMLYRYITALCYGSVWFFSVAVFYMVLFIMRAHLARGYRQRETRDKDCELRCYRRTAVMLLVLIIPMSGMVVLMVKSAPDIVYPGNLIYMTAFYTFYIMVLSIINIVKFRKVGSPILSAAKAINLVCAMLSILTLQSALISRFSPHDTDYRRLMDTITGSAVVIGVIAIALFMLIRAFCQDKGDKLE